MNSSINGSRSLSGQRYLKVLSIDYWEFVLRWWTFSDRAHGRPVLPTPAANGVLSLAFVLTPSFSLPSFTKNPSLSLFSLFCAWSTPTKKYFYLYLNMGSKTGFKVGALSKKIQYQHMCPATPPGNFTSTSWQFGFLIHFQSHAST